MNKVVSTIIILLIVLFNGIVYSPKALAISPNISADAAILMDAKTRQVLYAKNPFKKRPPASTTKVMTALLAIEYGKLGDKVTVSPQAARTEGSSMYLKAGQVLSLSDLLYGALMKSGNDACEAIAEHMSGSIEKFAVLMNTKALALGALNTHFTNPHGLPDKDHYTCAYDLALIALSAIDNLVFTEIVSTKYKTIEIEGEEWGRKIKNTNRLLWRYLWADGVKTGTTNAAGPCLISSATKGSRQLIAVVLNSGNRWADSTRLFEYGFNNFEYYQVAVSGKEFGRYKVYDGKKEEVLLLYERDMGIVIPKESPQALEKRINLESLKAPIKKGQVLGTVSYYVHNNFIGRVNLVSAYDIDSLGLFDKFIIRCRYKFNSIF